MKTHGGAEVHLHGFLTSARDGSGVVSFRPRPLYSGENPCIHESGLCKPQRRTG